MCEATGEFSVIKADRLTVLRTRYGSQCSQRCLQGPEFSVCFGLCLDMSSPVCVSVLLCLITLLCAPVLCFHLDLFA